MDESAVALDEYENAGLYGTEEHFEDEHENALAEDSEDEFYEHENAEGQLSEHENEVEVVERDGRPQIPFAQLLVAAVVVAVALYAMSFFKTEPLPTIHPARLLVQELNEQESRSHLTVLVVGKRGIGKHTLILDLFGKGEEYSNNTMAFSTSITFKSNGVSIEVLIMGSPADTRISSSFDLAIFMTRLDDAHYRTEDKEILVALTQKYGLPLWNKGMTVLTFANRLTKVDHTGLEQQSKEYLMKKTRDWKKNINKTLKGEGVPMSVLSDMPTVPVGHPSKVQLFDNMESWKTSLIKCMLVRLKASGMEASVAMWRFMKNNIQFQRDQSIIECEW